jgi:hypothetical protein
VYSSIVGILLLLIIKRPVICEERTIKYQPKKSGFYIKVDLNELNAISKRFTLDLGEFRK